MVSSRNNYGDGLATADTGAMRCSSIDVLQQSYHLEASVITEMMVSSLHCLSVITQSGNLARCNSGVVACLHFESCFVQST